MFQTLSYIGILISELAQRTARRGSRNATKRRSKITYSIMTFAAKPTHNNQKKKGKPPLCRTGYPYRQIPQRFARAKPSPNTFRVLRSVTHSSAVYRN